MMRPIVTLCIVAGAFLAAAFGCLNLNYITDGTRALELCLDQGLVCKHVAYSTLNFSASNVANVSEVFYNATLDTCHASGNTRKRFSLLYPGTKWCGKGNSAGNESELGSLSKTDTCCRQHDLYCAEGKVEAGDCKGFLCFPSFFTRLHCNCDDSFHSCLTNVKSTGSTSEKVASAVVGVTYFNLIGQSCFKKAKKFQIRVRGWRVRAGWVPGGYSWHSVKSFP